MNVNMAGTKKKIKLRLSEKMLIFRHIFFKVFNLF